MDIGLAVGLAVIFFLLGLAVGYLAFSEGQPKPAPAEKTMGTNQETLPADPPQSPGQTHQPEVFQRVEETVIQTRPTAMPEKLTAAQPTGPAANLGDAETTKPLTFSGAISDMFVRQTPSKESAAQQGIVGQIDRLLQEKLDETYVRRGLRMVQMPDQSMGIILDKITYGSIDSLPDETAKALIRQAVKEWTESQSPRNH